MGVVVGQGEVVWASLPEPTGPGPGLRRPVVVVQGDEFNSSRLATVVVVPLTSNLRWAAAPGNVTLIASRTGLPNDYVANVSQIVAVDQTILEQRVGRVPPRISTRSSSGSTWFSVARSVYASP